MVGGVFINIFICRGLWGRQRDTCTQKNRTQQLVDAFGAQLERMTDVHLTFSLAIADDPLPFSFEIPQGTVLEETRDVLVVDAFCKHRLFHSLNLILIMFWTTAASHYDLHLIGGEAYVASACMRQG